MLGIDHQHERYGIDEPGSDGGVSGRERGDGVHRAAARRGIQMDWAHAGAARVCSAEPWGEGASGRVFGTYDGPEPCSDNTAHSRLHRHRCSEGGGLSAYEVRNPLHQTGRGSSGVHRQESRQSERAGDKPHSGTRVQRIRPGRVPAPGGHFGGADLPVPQLGGLPQEEYQLPADAAHGDPESANGASRARRGVPGFCASTPYIRATGTESRVSITSTRWTKSRNGKSWWPRRKSPNTG